MKSHLPPDSKMVERTKEIAFKDFFIIMQKNKALDLIAKASLAEYAKFMESVQGVKI